MLEFEYYYKTLQLDMHWHMKNPFLHIQQTKQVKLKVHFNFLNNFNVLINISILGQRKIEFSISFSKLLCKYNTRV